MDTRPITATRHLAHHLRTDPDITPNDCNVAAAVIDALLDAIEAGGMVQPRPAPVMDLGPLRELRAWHHKEACRMTDRFTMLSHDKAVRMLNQYFPEGDRL